MAETVNPERGTLPDQDGTVESASTAILSIVEEEEKDQYESTRPEPSKEETTETKVSEEETVEPESEEEEEGEDQTETPLYTIKVDGKDTDVTLDELKSGYQKDSDYRKKTTELAEQRKAFEGQAQAIQMERQQYAQALGQVQTEASKQLAQYKQIDWDKLREDDTTLFMQRRDEMRELEKSIEDGHKQQQNLAYQAQAQQTQQFNQLVDQGKEKLLSSMPDWDDKVSKEVRTYGVGEGFTEDELSMLTDHRSMVVLRKAMMYDKIQTSQPSKKRVKAGTPRYVKSGVAKSKGDVSRKQSTDKMKRLRKSGSVDDGASLIYDMLDD